jgi:hypothetical protein
MNLARRILTILASVSVGVLTMVAATQMASGATVLGRGILFTVFGVVILAVAIVTSTKRWIGFTRFYIVLLFSGLFVFISSVYLDINSFHDIRNSYASALSDQEGTFRSNVDLLVQRTELHFADIADVTQEDGIDEEVEERETEEYVIVDGAILVGADGNVITLKNSPTASNPSWSELEAFLLTDDTDEQRYDFDTFVCADFAERLHNNAEQAGIKAAYVTVQLGPSSYFPSYGGHALNAFETTDRGLLFIDCTSGNYGGNADKIVDLEVGRDYVPTSVFPEPGFRWDSMGKLIEIEIVQW